MFKSSVESYVGTHITEYYSQSNVHCSFKISDTLCLVQSFSQYITKKTDSWEKVHFLGCYGMIGRRKRSFANHILEFVKRHSQKMSNTNSLK